MRLVNIEKLQDLQKNPANIRNICIMAHVDHGKTTLADSLVASNGIISARMAGKLRYMDSRKDEQERGITMKSSCIALYYNRGGSEYLVDLIDSPGHVDFSSEVSTAVRLCDGAVVLVDVVEGVCPQTQGALRQVWSESIKPVLVLNKVDRLIMEMKLSPLDAYIHLTQVLEQVNAIVGELFKTEVMRKAEIDGTKLEEEKKNDEGGGGGGENEEERRRVYDWGDGLEEADDSDVYFQPDRGNVVFASAMDGWGFRVEDFAKLYAVKLGLNVETLRQTLWGDFYLNSKTKRVMKGAQEKAKKPLFVQLVLENLWAVYETIAVRKDKEKLLKMCESMDVKMTSRDLRHTDSKVQLHAFCSQWLPLASAVLDMVCEQLPSPLQLTDERVERLMCPSSKSLDMFPRETQMLKEAFLKCSSSPEAPVIVFISKMFPIERKSLPQNRPKALTQEEITLRREQARLKHAEMLETGKCTATESVSPAVEKDQNESEDAFIAFARVYSGCLTRGSQVYVLGPKHDPSQALRKARQGFEIDPNLTLKDLRGGNHITRATISDLYLLMGRELEQLTEVPAGNVLGIGGLEDHLLKSAALSDRISCPAFSGLQLLATPILRVAIEPQRPNDLATLRHGLTLLNQADACVKVIVQETGEHVLVTAGEVHLERCLDDLKERYARVPINVSEPIVPFRETIVPPPKVDMVNEAISTDHNVLIKKDTAEETSGASTSDSKSTDGVWITLSTPNRQSRVRMRAMPLPEAVTRLLDHYSELLKTMHQSMKGAGCERNATTDQLMSDLRLNEEEDEEGGGEAVEEDEGATNVLTERTRRAIEVMRQKLRTSFEKEGEGEWSRESVDQIWSFGPRQCGPNLLINCIEGHTARNAWTSTSNSGTVGSLLDYDSSFVNGFQLATLAGPLCDEPMMGVAFVVDQWTVENTSEDQGASTLPYGPLSGQIMSMAKEACRKAFMSQPQRLMVAMYRCTIQVNANVQGKLYGVLNRRQGRVLESDLAQGSNMFSVVALLPVIESFNLAAEIRKQTSGLASTQLVFSHWQVLDVDPFWEPSTEEEYVHFGEKADSANRALKYVDAVRKRKGLPLRQQVVASAEKQRTLSKNK
ncbi:elongation factor-like GTPase 1 isoform X2 [Nilaparvata lugens]|uniref:elongation factor-like GTPase 1 isoform X1 n=1 Tax=Nilaparvata lugens TaxID=108931 RepID=UPI00193DAF1D|nr:elongation factor-like GTPase 1 isoform X1 [Nilaparvata lugens]XP_039291872.1 elongation factor-like GTPase 1 isoform X2 [Nilaparvata lugens]